MNPIIKEKWLQALRSGDYKQGKGSLRDKNGNFCCLGVLCDIYSREKSYMWTYNTDGTYSYMNFRELLPGEVWEWANPTNNSPATSTINPRNLASLNDQGVSFEEIADLIEKYL